MISSPAAATATLGAIWALGGTEPDDPIELIIGEYIETSRR
jgi:hypothetical protein